MLEFQFHGMNIGQLVLWFFIYSLAGWCMECLVVRQDLGKWENRGFAKMPFCIIYGFGTILALILFDPIKDNYVLLYLAGIIGGTIFEYITALVMKKIFGAVWWDYSHKKFNYKGILCLQSSLGWGIVVTVIFGVLNKYIESFVLLIDKRAVLIISLVLAVAYIIDFAYQFIKSLLLKRGMHSNMNNSLE